MKAHCIMLLIDVFYK